MNSMFYIFICFCYVITAYGACNVIAFGDGPFYVFYKIREIAYNIGEHFGKLFTCMMCLPANFGWICSIVNWFLIQIPFTPFNIILNGQEDLWLFAALCDGAFTSGMVYLLYIINEYLEKRIDYYEYNTPRDESNISGYDSMEQDGKILIVEDITLKNKNNDK